MRVLAARKQEIGKHREVPSSTTTSDSRTTTAAAPQRKYHLATPAARKIAPGKYRDMGVELPESGEDDEAEEQEEDALDGNKDTVFVTDGDSDVGQVCVF